MREKDGDIALAKQFLLDLCIREQLKLGEGTGEGLQYVLQNKVLHEKLEKGFLDKHPDAPRNINLGVDRIQKINDEIALFKETTISALVCVDVFDQIHQGNYKQAFLDILMDKREKLNSYSKIQSDIGKTMTICLAH